MNFMELLKLKPGTLILGCKVLNAAYTGRLVTPSTKGWSISKDYDDHNGRHPPPKQYVFYCARDIDEAPVIKTYTLQDFEQIKDVVGFAKANYEAYEAYIPQIRDGVGFVNVDYDKPIGMLLGEIVITRTPHAANNIWGIYVKMLIRDMVVWLQAVTVLGMHKPLGELDLV